MERRRRRILQAVLGEVFTGRIAVVSSFGADSAVLLHLVAEVDRATPVLFVDTGRHFPETLEHRDRLVRYLGLRGCAQHRAIARGSGAPRRRFRVAPPGIPMAAAPSERSRRCSRRLANFDAWITGRKRFQATTRRELPAFEVDGTQAKINPLAGWSQAEIDAYAARHGLPEHPLASRGYPSIGCAPCTSAILPGEDPRAGRWRGFEKTECGIHRPAAGPAGRGVREAAMLCPFSPRDTSLSPAVTCRCSRC